MASPDGEGVGNGGGGAAAGASPRSEALSPAAGTPRRGTSQVPLTPHTEPEGVSAWLRANRFKPDVVSALENYDGEDILSLCVLRVLWHLLVCWCPCPPLTPCAYPWVLAPCRRPQRQRRLLRAHRPRGRRAAALHQAAQGAAPAGCGSHTACSWTVTPSGCCRPRTFCSPTTCPTARLRL